MPEGHSYIPEKYVYMLEAHIHMLEEQGYLPEEVGLFSAVMPPTQGLCFDWTNKNNQSSILMMCHVFIYNNYNI